VTTTNNCTCFVTYLSTRVYPPVLGRTSSTVPHVPQSISLVLITAMSTSRTVWPIIDFRSKRNQEKVGGFEEKVGQSALWVALFFRPVSRLKTSPVIRIPPETQEGFTRCPIQMLNYVNVYGMTLQAWTSF
jgi:hypothetical protein